MDRNIFQIAPSPIQPEMPPHCLLPWEQMCPGQGEARDGKISSWDCSTGRTHPIHLTSPDTGGTNKNPHHRPPQPASAASVLPRRSPGFRISASSGLGKPSTIIEGNLPKHPLVTKAQSFPQPAPVAPHLQWQQFGASSCPSEQPPGARGRGQGRAAAASGCSGVFSTPTCRSRQVGDPSRSPAKLNYLLFLSGC